LLFCLLIPAVALAGELETDSIATSAGPLEITFLGHASLEMKFNDKYVYIDPCGEYANYSQLPKADIVLFTQGSFRPERPGCDTVRKHAGGAHGELCDSI
jgi:hypothetical protein